VPGEGIVSVEGTVSEKSTVLEGGTEEGSVTQAAARESEFVSRLDGGGCGDT
jgi:hypothetical protein